MGKRRATGSTEADCEALGAREVVALDVCLATEPPEILESGEEVGGVAGARGPAAARAMAVHEAKPRSTGQVANGATEAAALDLLNLGHVRYPPDGLAVRLLAPLECGDTSVPGRLARPERPPIDRSAGKKC
jgi:hypothetical protein